MDRAYKDGYTRYIAQTLKFDLVVSPKKNRVTPWEYDKALYKKRNEVERLFRLLQGFRYIFCRFDKLDSMYTGFILLALVFIALNIVGTRPNQQKQDKIIFSSNNEELGYVKSVDSLKGKNGMNAYVSNPIG